MQPPIMVIEHGNIDIFDSISKAEKYLEPIDARNEEYEVYDKDGHLLKLDVEEMEKVSFFGKLKVEGVKIYNEDDGEDHTYELRKALIDLFRKTSTYDFKDEGLPLHELVNKAVKTYGYTK